MNRAEYEPDMIQDISNFLSKMILSGCGLEPPQRVIELKEVKKEVNA